ncbi:MAG: hypothetical protein IJ299_00965 [Oscillospiraceae bacterium]|nr:hypothetical protein [Oscillospiraceae bacterium]
MHGKEKYIIAVLCVALAVCIALIVFEIKPEETAVSPDVRISLRLSKDSLLSLLEKNGIKLPGKARMAMAFIPDTITLFFDADAGDKNALSELRINGQKISHEILKDICENYLDFSCTLVYNRT